jgi:acyl carrier protein
MDRDHLKSLLGEIFADVTGENLGPLRDEQRLKDELNVDSLEWMSLAIVLHERLGITVEVSEVNEIATVGDLVGLVQAKLFEPPAPANAASAA